MPALLVWFRLQRVGREHARMKGGMIVASNHRSFLDPFVIGALLPWRRRMQFLAKVELFENRWIGWLLTARRLPDPAGSRTRPRWRRRG